MTPSYFIPRNTALRQAWAAYILSLPARIGTPYEYWGTLTYRDAEEIPPRHARDITAKRFSYFIGEINRHIFGPRWMRNGEGVWGAIATEDTQRGYPHHHFILGSEWLRKGIKRLEIMDMWDEMHGIARVKDYRGEAAARYITKYVTKGGDIDVFASARVREKLKSLG